MENKKELAKNKLGLLSSIMMGVAGTAPAFSIEVTASTILATVGFLAPASILYCGLIMLGVAFAFINLNKVIPSAGTSYTWVSATFGKTLGYTAGWSLLSAVALFMVSGTLPIANATLLLFYPSMVNNVSAIACVSLLWLTLVSLVVLKGIKISSIIQNSITIFEMIILCVVLVYGYSTWYAHPLLMPSIDWFNPTHFTSALFVSGALIALFFYWGWDVVLNLSEETKQKEATPSRAVSYVMAILMFIFISFIILILMSMTQADIEHYNTNIIFGLVNTLFGAKFGYVAIIVVLLSTLGTIETGMLQFTRTLFAKSRDGMMPDLYRRVHHRWQTPHVATIALWGIGSFFIIACSYIDSVKNMLAISIGTIGVLTSVYLSLTAFACAFYFKAYYKEVSYRAVTHVYYPLCSGLFLLYIILYSVIAFDFISKMICFGVYTFGAMMYFYMVYGKDISKK